ncbi:MAG TPA: TRAP transporter large permease subunit [Atribacterota bacterium]|nr:TRAP transporter large permease subunit [Atribacterota bacterium]
MDKKYGVISLTSKIDNYPDYGLGIISSPVAVNLYVAANLINSTLDKVAKEVWIYVIAVIAGLIFLTFFPQISLYFPVASGLYIP